VVILTEVEHLAQLEEGPDRSPGEDDRSRILNDEELQMLKDTCDDTKRIEAIFKELHSKYLEDHERVAHGLHSHGTRCLAKAKSLH